MKKEWVGSTHKVTKEDNDDIREYYRSKKFKKAYADNVVLEDISFTVKKSEKVVLIGPSGGGKVPYLGA